VNEPQWTQSTYESSITRLCWRDSAYAQGWDACPAIAADDELRQIVGMELELETVPEWARRIVVDSLHSLPGCGHYLFPLAFLDILEAIGAEQPQAFVHGCYTVARARKQEMIDYVLCLDGWLAGAEWPDVARELNALGYRRLDWDAVCTDLWEVLGEHDELKDRLVERLILLQRWAIKKTAWDDDRASQFGRDRYLGPYSETPGRDGVSRWTHADPPAPDFDVHASPRLQRLEARIAELHPGTPVPGWGGDHLTCGWLCAPKAFRYLERIVWEIGGGRLAREGERVPGFLRCEDTWFDLAEAAEWWRAYLAALDGWWRGTEWLGQETGHSERETGHSKPNDRLQGAVADQVSERLGAPTPVKRWLVRLLRHSLRLGETVWWARWPDDGRAFGRSGTKTGLGIGD
jgi:hypothetical protein